MSNFICSGCDGTVRIWSLPNNSQQQFLQHTCIFDRGEERRDEDLDGSSLHNLTWCSNGRLLAASMDNLINIWVLSGMLGSLFIERKSNKYLTNLRN